MRPITLIAAALCLVCGAQAHAADGQNNTLPQAAALDSGGAVMVGAIDVLGDSDWYSFDTPPGVTMDSVEIQKTNNGCGIQASLFGTAGDRLGGVLVGDGRTEVLRLVSPVAQRYFVMIDDGTLFFCTGAEYAIRLLPSEPIEPSQAGTAARRARDPLGCVTATSVVDQFTYRVRQDRARLHQATSASKRTPWRRRLRHDKAELKVWRRLAKHACGP